MVTEAGTEPREREKGKREGKKNGIRRKPPVYHFFFNTDGALPGCLEVKIVRGTVI